MQFHHFLYLYYPENQKPLCVGFPLILKFFSICFTIFVILFYFSYGAELSACVMEHWQNSNSREEGREMEVIELFAYIANMSAKDAWYLGGITQWLCSKLKDEKLSLSLLTRCLDIVPALLTWDTEHHEELR